MSRISSSPAPAASARDPRVDILRGLALLMIFLDHIPGDDLNRYTMRNFGFSDAAEIFVMLSGFASMMAYGGVFSRQGAWAGLRKVAMRVVRLYVFQIGMLVVTFLTVRSWTEHYHLAPLGMASMIDHGLRGLKPGLTLRAQPPDLNILPLYIVLLAMFPAIYALMRVRPWLTVALSGALWAFTHVDPALNFTNTLDGHLWFFNPFAWQFLFVLGAGLAILVRRNAVPTSRWLMWLCGAWLLVAFVEAAPWHDWGLPNLSPFPLTPPDKTNLSPLRLLHVLCVVLLVLGSPRLLALFRTQALRGITYGIEACGRNSLEVFTLGTMLSLLGRLLFRTWGMTQPMQFLVNGVGLTAMVLLGVGLDRLRRPRVRQPAVPITSTPSEPQIV